VAVDESVAAEFGDGRPELNPTLRPALPKDFGRGDDSPVVTMDSSDPDRRVSYSASTRPPAIILPLRPP
jgi:hypothetical protein